MIDYSDEGWQGSNWNTGAPSSRTCFGISSKMTGPCEDMPGKFIVRIPSI